MNWRFEPSVVFAPEIFLGKLHRLAFKGVEDFEYSFGSVVVSFLTLVDGFVHRVGHPALSAILHYWHRMSWTSREVRVNKRQSRR